MLNRKAQIVTDHGVSRRSLFRVAGVGAAVVGGGALLEACSSGIQGASSSSSPSSGAGTATGASTSGAGTSKDITIGWVHPLTGSLAGFGYPDNWVLQQVMATPQFKNGIKVGGSTYAVSIKSYDTQSSVTRAGALAKQAIQQDNVDLLFASSTPETVNAVASEAETLGTPLICSNIPWESWYINLGGNPQKPTLKPKWTVMYFLGAEHLALAFIPMWNRIGATYGNNHKVAAAFPNDSDGNAFRAVFPPILKGAGYTIDMSTAYPDGLTNYTSMITEFKNDGDDFLTNSAAPGLRDHVDPVPAAGLQAEARDGGQAAAVPDRRLRDGLQGLQRRHRRLVGAGATVALLPDRTDLPKLATAFTPRPGQPNQNISNYTLFEIAYAALTAVDNPHDKTALAAALFRVKLPEAVAGPVDYTSTNTKTNPAPGVAITPPVGIQWQKGTTYQLEYKTSS